MAAENIKTVSKKGVTEKQKLQVISYPILIFEKIQKTAEIFRLKILPSFLS
jgi:hypothetical protein